MSFKDYFEEYMNNQKTQIEEFLKLIEEKPFKVLVIKEEEDYQIFDREPSKISTLDYKGTILYCAESAMIISEEGNHKIMDTHRIPDFKKLFNLV